MLPPGVIPLQTGTSLEGYVTPEPFQVSKLTHAASIRDYGLEVWRWARLLSWKAEERTGTGGRKENYQGEKDGNGG